jgi:hypothetical protein
MPGSDPIDSEGERIQELAQKIIDEQDPYRLLMYRKIKTLFWGSEGFDERMDSASFQLEGEIFWIKAKERSGEDRKEASLWNGEIVWFCGNPTGRCD